MRCTKIVAIILGDYKGLCPVAEEVIPKVLMVMPMGLKEEHARNAKALRKAWEGCVK